MLFSGWDLYLRRWPGSAGRTGPRGFPLLSWGSKQPFHSEEHYHFRLKLLCTPETERETIRVLMVLNAFVE